jgi:hypothetical protein
MPQRRLLNRGSSGVLACCLEQLEKKKGNTAFCEVEFRKKMEERCHQNKEGEKRKCSLHWGRKRKEKKNGVTGGRWERGEGEREREMGERERDGMGIN